jgi:hypothetical protein
MQSCFVLQGSLRGEPWRAGSWLYFTRLKKKTKDVATQKNIGCYIFHLVVKINGF